MNEASSDLTINTTEVVNDMVLIQWSNGEEGMVPLKKLREHCPCAVCAGETDVFGNVYRGPQKEKTDDSYRLVALERVGYYGLRPIWADGHDSGIFTGDLLKTLAE